MRSGVAAKFVWGLFLPPPDPKPCLDCHIEGSYQHQAALRSSFPADCKDRRKSHTHTHTHAPRHSQRPGDCHLISSCHCSPARSLNLEGRHTPRPPSVSFKHTVTHTPSHPFAFSENSLVPRTQPRNTVWHETQTSTFPPNEKPNDD